MSSNPTDEFTQQFANTVLTELTKTLSYDRSIVIDDAAAKQLREALASIQASTAKMVEALWHDVWTVLHDTHKDETPRIKEPAALEVIDQLIKDLTGEGK